MLVGLDRLGWAYDRIRQNGTAGGAMSTLIFAAPTCDSLAAWNILKVLLERDFVLYSLRPVSCYEDIERVNQELLVGRSDIKSVVFLDCGGTVDLFELLEFAEGSERTVYIFDSHRPYHLGLVHATQEEVCVFESEADHVKVPGVDVWIEAVQAAEEEDDEEDEEDEDEEDPQEAAAEEEEEEDPEGDGSVAGKRPAGATASQREYKRQRNHRRACAELVTDYYRGEYSSRSASQLLYVLATQLRRDNNDLLWLAIIGLTDQFLHDRIDRMKYIAEVEELQEEVLRHNVESDDGNQDSSSSRSANWVKITFEEEFRFLLLRHWTLYDSMFYSNYVVSKLGLWREPGRVSMQRLLARMGLPLEECRQKYSHMKADMKRSLREKMTQYAPEFGLENITYGSFSKVASWEQNFYHSFKALANNGSTVFEEGIKKAKSMQMSTARKGMQMEDRKMIKSFPSFRHAVFEAKGEDAVFLSSHALRKLALFLMELDRGAHAPDSTMALVVAVTGTSRTGLVQKNNFGRTFDVVADQSQVNIQQRGFDASVIEIERDRITDFLAELCVNLH